MKNEGSALFLFALFRLLLSTFAHDCILGIPLPRNAIRFSGNNELKEHVCRNADIHQLPCTHHIRAETATAKESQTTLKRAKYSL